MAIQTDCEGCGALLSVDDQHAGKSAECPQCGQSYLVPSQERGPVDSRQTGWELQTPEGKTYGPVDRGVLERWTAEGRVDAHCRLRQGTTPWRGAHEVFEQLKPEVSDPWLGNPFATADEEPTGILAPLPNLEPHRGPLVLGLGIAGFLVPCPMMSVVAWVMGNHDLRKMQTGRMDPGGYGLTQAGRVFGMVFSILWLALFAMIVFACMFLIAVS